MALAGVGRHDFYSHHRRFNFDHPGRGRDRFKTNAARYSYDFTVVDADGNRYRGNGEKHEDHFAYGRPVLAPGDGTVVQGSGRRQRRGLRRGQHRRP
jgi:hypothetical protein